jgi:hypothetical protein
MDGTPRLEGGLLDRVLSIVSVLEHRIGKPLACRH